MVPILVITGPVGVGKSTVLHEIDGQLISAGVAHATVELEELARCWTPDSSNHATLVEHNLAAVWANFAAYGAQRLAIGMLLEDPATLRRLSQTIRTPSPRSSGCLLPLP